MAKKTFGAKGNAEKLRKKEEEKKAREKAKLEKESKPKRAYRKRETTQELLDKINSQDLVDEEIATIYHIPEHLLDDPKEEDLVLYDNDYIRQSLEIADQTRENFDNEEFRKLYHVNGEDVKFTNWDVRIDDPIEYFDPDLSYELTGYRPITETQGLDFDPDWFREPAMTKEATGKYSSFEINGPSYVKYWLEQQRRCIYGYTYNGYTLTGDNYFYLNFYRMDSPAVLKSDSKAKVTVRNDSFPTFIAEQYKYFHYVELCKKLGLNVFALKSRGIGWSEMGACLGVNLYTVKRRQQAIYTAFTDLFVSKTLEKCWRQLDYLNTETEGGFKHLRQAVNTATQKKASKKDREGNESGFGSMITGIVADKPSKVRGDRAEMLLYEEVGSDPVLIKKWIQGDALIIVGGSRIGFKIGYGTGGDEGPAVAGLNELFYNPKEYDILPYKHNHTADGEYIVTSYFIPAYSVVIIDGIIDKRGVCNKKKAVEYYNKKRDAKAGSPEGYLTYCAEYCYNPDEALSRQGDNIFDSVAIAARITDIKVHGSGIKPKVGIVDYSYSKDLNQDILKFLPSPNGKVRIYELPRHDENGDLFKNLYVAGIDSIDQGIDQSTGQKDVSDYCLVIKRRTFGLEPPKYVAIYKDRPRNIKEAYNQTIKLLEFYGCQAVLESSRTAIVNHFKDRKKQGLLMRRPSSVNPTNKVTNTDMFGVYPSKQTIEYYLELIADFVLEYCFTIDDLAMLEELSKYSFEDKRKFDIIAAMGMCEIGDQEMRTWGAVAKKMNANKMKPFGYWYDDNGIKHYGVKPDPIQDLQDLANLQYDINDDKVARARANLQNRRYNT